jgi:hypothetical protein
VILIAAVVALALVVGAGGYGYHRDELYFLEAGHHLAWGYADQGPLTPLLAHLMDLLDPGSLTVLRIPSALMAAGTVTTTGLIARELGAPRSTQLLAASCCAVASVVLVTGHLLSTTTFDLLAWAVLSWLVVRIVRGGHEQLWLAAGAVAGLALLDKPLLAFYVAALGAALLLVGPRHLLRSRWLWAGLVLALAMWSPWLIWQSRHGWPQLDVSSNIASGGSTSSQRRWALVPFQFLLVSPPLAPVWIAGLIAPFRLRALRPFRFFAVAWLLLVVVYTATGGKPYYLAGMFPVMLALGSIPLQSWLSRGGRARTATFWTAVGLSGVVSAVLALPILPARHAGIAVASDPDVGETIGWPDLVRQVGAAYHRAGNGAVIFTSNYGEAGAIDRYGPELGLPQAYSGHNGFGYWGPPPDRRTSVVTIGLSSAERAVDFTGCRVTGRVGNRADIDNDERGEPIAVCAGTRGPWSSVWPRVRRLG